LYHPYIFIYFIFISIVAINGSVAGGRHPQPAPGRPRPPRGAHGGGTRWYGGL